MPEVSNDDRFACGIIAADAAVQGPLETVSFCFIANTSIINDLDFSPINCFYQQLQAATNHLLYENRCIQPRAITQIEHLYC